MHIKDKSAIKEIHISKIADSLNSLIWDRIIIFVSGDIAFSGESSQYKIAKVFFHNLIDKIRSRCNHKKWIDIIMVPGNHDVNHNGNSMSAANLLEIRNKNTYLNYLENEFSKQQNFLSFIKPYNLFDNNKVWDRKIIDYDNFTVEINLINSALFSILEEDKGLHFLPDNCLDEIVKPSHADFVISIMHHSPEWYFDEQKNKLDEIICRKSSIIMYGHEHYNARKTISYEAGRDALIQAGGCLCQNSDWSNSSFHLGVFDTDTNLYQHKQFTWNNAERQYESDKTDEFTLPIKRSEEHKLQMTNSFLKFLHEDEKRKIANDFMEYFVFPRLETDEVQNTDIHEITTDREFLNELKRRKRIIISGGYNSGKTILLKRIAIALLNDFVIVYCQHSDIQKKKTDRIIKNIFQEIYGESESNYNRFQQTPKMKKVFIMDDVDQIDKTDFNNFIADIGKSFEYIVLATRQIVDLDLLERMKAQLKVNDTIYTYKITPIFADKRLEIIQKIVALKTEDIDSIDKTVNLLSEALTSQRNFISLDPDFIIQYVEYYCRNIGEASIGDSSVFSKVFEANITMAISRYQTKHLSVDKIFVLLSKVAHYIHFKKAYPITETQISELIGSYNNEYGSTVRTSEFIGNIINAKILVADEQADGYRFVNKNYLAYFVARELNREYNTTGDDSNLKTVLHSACFGINADVLMFVSYITDNIKILNLILDMARTYTNGWDEFDFKTNLPKFFKVEKTHSVSISSTSYDEADTKNQVDNERITNKKMKTLDIYDYSDAEADNKVNTLIRSLQLLLVIAKCLPNFEHTMKKEDKEAFVSAIYSMPNKIFSKWAETIDTEIDDILHFFKEQSNDYYGRQKNVTDNDIIKALQWSAMSFLLDLYNLPVYYSAKEHTLQYLNGFNYKSRDTYSLEHLMMLERVSLSSTFSKESILLKDDRKGCIFSTMLTRVIKHALIFKKELDYQQRQQLVSKFFPGKNLDRQLLIQRVKNRGKDE